VTTRAVMRFLVALAVSVLPVVMPSGITQAQQKPCGLPGGPTCPPPIPLTTPYVYYADGWPGFYSELAEIGQDFSAYEVSPGNRCTSNYTGASETTGGPWGGVMPTYYLGIVVQRTYALTFAETFVRYPDGPYWPPSCTESGTRTLYAIGSRSVYCPDNASIQTVGNPPIAYCGETPARRPAPKLEKVPGSCSPGSQTPGTNSGGANSGTGRSFKGNPCADHLGTPRKITRPIDNLVVWHASSEDNQWPSRQSAKADKQLPQAI